MVCETVYFIILISFADPKDGYCFLRAYNYLDLANVETHDHIPVQNQCKDIMKIVKQIDDKYDNEEDNSLVKLQELTLNLSDNKNKSIHRCFTLCGLVTSVMECRHAVNKKVRINNTDANGQTMLHMAFRQNNRGMQMLLLNAGADLTKRDANGCLPFVANNNDNPRTKNNVGMLEDYFKSPLKPYVTSTRQCNIRVARLCYDLNQQGLYFVICIPENTKSTQITVLDNSYRNRVRIVVNQVDSNESKLVDFHENTCTGRGENVFVQPEDSKKLFSRHSNVNMIMGSAFKSTGFGTEDHVIVRKACVTLYCYHKGYVPFGEESFPDKIGEYDTDVREGYCCFAANPLNIGDGISKRRSQIGTLGGFVDLPDGRKGLITCAHVLHSASDLKNERFGIGHSVSHLDGTTLREIGKIKKAVFTTDKPSEVSVDAALVEINPDVSISGHFTDVQTHQLYDLGMT